MWSYCFLPISHRHPGGLSLRIMWSFLQILTGCPCSAPSSWIIIKLQGSVGSQWVRGTCISVGESGAVALWAWAHLGGCCSHILGPSHLLPSLNPFSKLWSWSVTPLGFTHHSRTSVEWEAGVCPSLATSPRRSWVYRGHTQEAVFLLIFSPFAHTHSQIALKGPKFWLMIKNLKFLNTLDPSP